MPIAGGAVKADGGMMNSNFLTLPPTTLRAARPRQRTATSASCCSQAPGPNFHTTPRPAATAAQQVAEGEVDHSWDETTQEICSAGVVEQQRCFRQRYRHRRARD